MCLQMDLVYIVFSVALKYINVIQLYVFNIGGTRHFHWTLPLFNSNLNVFYLNWGKREIENINVVIRNYFVCVPIFAYLYFV